MGERISTTLRGGPTVWWGRPAVVPSGCPAVVSSGRSVTVPSGRLDVSWQRCRTLRRDLADAPASPTRPAGPDSSRARNELSVPAPNSRRGRFVTATTGKRWGGAESPRLPSLRTASPAARTHGVCHGPDWDPVAQ